MKRVFKIYALICALGFTLLSASSKAQNYELVAIGYYNLENLFDTIDSEGVEEGDFLPDGAKGWNADKYFHKLNQMSKVIAEIATDETKDGLAVFGVSEIENRMVLEDLVKTGGLKERNYEIVHYNSPDRRGIDVALVYNPKYFSVSHSASIPLIMEDTGFRTRDQLVVSGKLLGEEVHFQVNHWPSRSGGEKRSRPKRDAAGQLARSIADSILSIDTNAKIIIMGDLNDDPTNNSVAKYLMATDKKVNWKRDISTILI
jgi:hypothetical protein